VSGELGLTIKNKVWEQVMRPLVLIALFIGAYSLVQGILVLIRNLGQQDISMLVVVLYLLVTPFCFSSALLFALAIHRMAQDKEGERFIVWGFAMMIMATVDNLIYTSIHYEGDSISFIILGGIELICYIILFLYYQGVDYQKLAICSGILLVACAVLKLEEAIRYYISIDYYDFIGYYFAQTVLNTLLAVISLLLIFSLQKNIIMKRNVVKKD